MAFKKGTVVIDLARKKVGVYMDKIGTQIHIRPLGGGCEWQVTSAYVRAATPEECASAQAALLAAPAPIRRP